MVSGKYLYSIAKNRKAISDLEKYYSKLKDNQKAEINKTIENDISYAPKRIQKYIKMCRNFIFYNKFGIKKD